MLRSLRLSKSRKLRPQRHPLLGIAKLSGDQGWMDEAVIREISKGGARLSHDRPKSIPDRISIQILQEKIHAKGTVRWRKKNAFGVSFDAPIELPDLPEDPLNRARHLGWVRPERK